MCNVSSIYYIALRKPKAESRLCRIFDANRNLQNASIHSLISIMPPLNQAVNATITVSMVEEFQLRGQVPGYRFPMHLDSQAGPKVIGHLFLEPHHIFFLQAGMLNFFNHLFNNLGFGVSIFFKIQTFSDPLHEDVVTRISSVRYIIYYTIYRHKFLPILADVS